VHRSRLTRGWIFSRYDHCLQILRDRRLSSDFRHSNLWPRTVKMQLAAGRTEEELDRPTMLNSDPPRHTRLRGLVSKAFTPRAVRALEGRMVEIVDEVLAPRAGASEIEIIDDLAYPLPVIVIAEMLGIPAEDRERFRHWSDEAVRGLAAPNVDDMKASIKAGRELYAYLEPIAAERKLNPRDDLLSGLLQAEESGDRLTMEEVYQTVTLLLVAGNETTTKLIGNGMLALLRNPEQLALLREQPDLIDTAVEELLRWDGPVHMTARNAVESFEYEGAKIEKGQMVAVALAAANRDPEVFENPETLDITRADNPHLSFGHGLHFCLGSSLARLEARTAIGALVSRYPAMKLATDRPEWGPNLALRGLKALPVRV
jgi:cytochrome P450